MHISKCMSCLFSLPFSVLLFHTVVDRGRGSFLVLFTSYSLSLPPLPVSGSGWSAVSSLCFPGLAPSVFQGNLNHSLTLMHSLSTDHSLNNTSLTSFVFCIIWKPCLPDLFPTGSLILPLLVMSDPLRANFLTQAAHAQV